MRFYYREFDPVSDPMRVLSLKKNIETWVKRDANGGYE